MGTVISGPAGVVALGVALLAVSGWSWAGRSGRARFWVGRPQFRQLMLAVLPGMGLAALGGGVGTLFPSTTPVVVWPVLVGVVLILAGMLGFLPRWWAPRWYRELPPDKRGADPRRSPVAAAMKGYLGRPGVVSAKDAAARFGHVRPLQSWPGGWVYDPDTDERTSAMSRKGTVQGRLTLYPVGMVFAASRAEDVLRGRGTVLALHLDDITGVRVVPARAGADGRPRPGRLYRSRYPRLVVATAKEEHVFDVARGQADKVAERLSALTGQVR